MDRSIARCVISHVKSPELQKPQADLRTNPRSSLSIVPIRGNTTSRRCCNPAERCYASSRDQLHASSSLQQMNISKRSSSRESTVNTCVKSPTIGLDHRGLILLSLLRHEIAPGNSDRFMPANVFGRNGLTMEESAICCFVTIVSCPRFVIKKKKLQR